MSVVTSGKPKLMQTLEAWWGRPFEEVVIDAQIKHGSRLRVAEALGLSRTTIYVWLKRLGMTWKDVQLAALRKDRAAWYAEGKGQR